MKLFFSTTLFFITLFIFCSCRSNTATVTPPQVMHNKDSMSIGAYAFKTADGWGYSITVDDKLFIKQSTMPVVEGNHSFVSEADALKVANEVMGKLKFHQKPTLQKADLQRLGVII